ncbi:hypothetical protein [Faecalimonas sp.]
MACYDCEECSKNISNGGKCNRFEYNCPFLAVEKYNTEKIVKLRNKIKMISDSVLQLLELDSEEFFEDEISMIRNQLVEMEEKVSEELVEKWKKINSTL